jgi:hypothetical protein
MLDANNYEQTEVTEQKLLWQFGTSSDPDVIKILAENTITEITTSNCDTANPCVMGICTDRDYSSERGEEENTSYFSFATWYRDLGDYESLQSRSTAVPQVFPATNNAFQFLMPYIFGGTYYAGSFDIFDVRFNQSDKTDLIVSTDLKPISIDPRTGTRYTATSTVSSVCVI